MNPFSDNSRVIPIADANARGRKVRARQKGRSVDAQALANVRALLADSPRRRDLLIEFLHRIQDAKSIGFKSRAMSEAVH